jgi:RimJ/RimL family protein N-acetyltransferase
VALGTCNDAEQPAHFRFLASKDKDLFSNRMEFLMNLETAQGFPVTLPSGRTLDLTRSRWSGTLSDDEVRFCRENGIALGYDPVQHGWVLWDAPDAIEEVVAATSVPADRSMVMPQAAPTGIVLRPWVPEDLPAFVGLLDDPAVWEHLPEEYPAPLTEDLARDLIEVSALTDHHDVRAIEWSGKPVGQVRLLFGADGSAEISYWLGRAYWGKGIGGDAVARFTAESFTHRPDVMSIFAKVHPENRGSARVLERAGYTPAGIDPDDGTRHIFRMRRTG